MGSAIAFNKGSAIEGYGEPDSFTKLMLMQDTLLLINEKGIDDPSVRDALKNLLMTSRFDAHFNITMIDVMIRRIRPLKEAADSSRGGGKP